MVYILAFSGERFLFVIQPRYSYDFYSRKYRRSIISSFIDPSEVMAQSRHYYFSRVLIIVTNKEATAKSDLASRFLFLFVCLQREKTFSDRPKTVILNFVKNFCLSKLV